MLSPQYSTYAAMSKLNYELAIFQTYLSNETLIADIGMSSKKKLYHIHAYKNHSKNFVQIKINIQ